MTTATDRADVLALASHYASDAAQLRLIGRQSEIEAADHRAAAAAAERAALEANGGADDLAAKVHALAVAIGWAHTDIIRQTNHEYRSDDSVSYRAAFAGGRVTSAPKERGRAPQGRAYGWRIDAAGRSSAEALEYWEHVPPAGTNDPDKLAAQRGAATDALLDWLGEHTGAAFLRAQGLDPATVPPLLSLVGVSASTEPRGYGGERYHRPTWTLTLAGLTIAALDNTDALLRPDEADVRNDPGPTIYKRSRAILGSCPDDAAGAQAWAERHAERARDAMLRWFDPDYFRTR